MKKVFDGISEMYANHKYSYFLNNHSSFGGTLIFRKDSLGIHGQHLQTCLPLYQNCILDVRTANDISISESAIFDLTAKDVDLYSGIFCTRICCYILFTHNGTNSVIFDAFSENFNISDNTTILNAVGNKFALLDASKIYNIIVDRITPTYLGKDRLKIFDF